VIPYTRYLRVPATTYTHTCLATWIPATYHKLLRRLPTATPRLPATTPRIPLPPFCHLHASFFYRRTARAPCIQPPPHTFLTRITWPPALPLYAYAQLLRHFTITPAVAHMPPGLPRTSTYLNAIHCIHAPRLYRTHHRTRIAPASIPTCSTAASPLRRRLVPAADADVRATHQARWRTTARTRSLISMTSSILACYRCEALWRPVKTIYSSLVAAATLRISRRYLPCAHTPPPPPHAWRLLPSRGAGQLRFTARRHGISPTGGNSIT